MNKAKRTSSKRFQQLNKLVDVIGPHLDTTSQFAVLMSCYRHARERGVFQVSCSRIAKVTKLSVRQVRRILEQLKKRGVIEQISDHRGPIPPQFRITGQINNVDTDDNIQPLCDSINVDTHDR